MSSGKGYTPYRGLGSFCGEGRLIGSKSRMLGITTVR